jgi:hypothetical protein
VVAAPNKETEVEIAVNQSQSKLSNAVNVANVKTDAVVL